MTLPPLPTELLGFASRTHGKRNVETICAYEWGWLVSPFDRGGPILGDRPHVVDNGAWKCFLDGIPFDGAAFRRTLAEHGAGSLFCVCPDIVAGGAASMELSRNWLPEMLDDERLSQSRILFAVQDGMVPADIDDLVNDRVGIFLGGSTVWKVGTAMMWGQYCRERGLWFHFARANSAKRIFLCQATGAHSFDGTSTTVYSSTMPLLDGARRMPDMFAAVA